MLAHTDYHNTNALRCIFYDDSPSLAYFILIPIGLLFVFLLVKQVQYRKSPKLEKKYKLLLFLSIALNLVASLFMAAYSTHLSFESLIYSPEYESVLAEQRYIQGTSSVAHALTFTYLLIAIITILVQKPINKESDSIP
ncbi:hypothetical protein Rhal01_00044 [Rubritalea halochordaticola]|uniref:DUF420 domain-containing protein n=1 Tax=Rubritalea halochordaticola TaxID=714537 RepID=A0ABP9UXY1_9BACT